SLPCFFPATAPPHIYSLSLHDALPILEAVHAELDRGIPGLVEAGRARPAAQPIGALLAHPHPRRRLAHDPAVGQFLDELALALGDRKSTRLNSSHVKISYAVFCLKKKR